MKKIELEKRICGECNNEFDVDKKSKKKFCCSICAQTNNGKRNKGRKHTEESKQKQRNVCSGEKNPMYKKTIYDVWVDKFGKEIADQKLEQYKANKKGKHFKDKWIEELGEIEGLKKWEKFKIKKRESMLGEKNPFFNKKHKPESLAIISEKSSIGNTGEKNPMFGKGYKIKGEKNGSWFGGISLIEYGPDWTDQLRNNIRKRDNFICVICGKHGYEVHHIDYNKHNNLEENLITLCRSDHAKTGFNRESWMEYFKIIIDKIYAKKQ